jgi:hypothetical protein
MTFIIFQAISYLDRENREKPSLSQGLGDFPQSLGDLVNLIMFLGMFMK